MTDEQTGQQNDVKMPKGRSPSYPGISLSTAIERAKKIYDEFKQFQVPMAKVTSRWGYTKPTTGPASVTYAALKKWGLLTDTGNGDQRVARITDLAVKILHPNPGQEAAIREAALTPPIMREWWDRYQNDVPPMDSLHWQFVVQGPFTESGLTDFVRVYTDTVSFAKLAVAATVISENEPTQEEGDHGDEEKPGSSSDRKPDARLQRRRRSEGDGAMTYTVPVAVGTDVTIEGRFPLTEAEWTQLIAVLTAMKPGLVGDTAGRSVEDDGEPHPLGR